MKLPGILGLVSALFLTSCSLLPLSADEQKYVDNCQIVYDNYQKYIEVQTKFYDADYDDQEFDWQSWPSTYAITNAGEASRDVARASIDRNFPWIEKLVSGYFEGMSRAEFLEQEPSSWFDGDLGVLAFEAFFKEMATGSTFHVTDAFLKQAQKKEVYELFDVEINEIFSQFSPSDRFEDCDAALGLDESASFASNWDDYELNGLTGVGIQTLSHVRIGIWGCDNFGVGYVDYGDGWRKCSGSDFDYSKYATAPSTELTEEERAILEEREANADRESRNPSGSTETSNVTPGQICNSLGALVQTENYGTLMCKLVWVNKIRALVWMRT